MALDFIELKIFKPIISKAKREAPTRIHKVSFLNKGVELINLPPYFPLSISEGMPTY